MTTISRIMVAYVWLVALGLDLIELGIVNANIVVIEFTKNL